MPSAVIPSFKLKFTISFFSRITRNVLVVEPVLGLSPDITETLSDSGATRYSQAVYSSLVYPRLALTGKEIIPGTDEEEEEFQEAAPPFVAMDANEDADGSLPPTRIAWRFRSPITALGRSPFLSSLFKLLGAPSALKTKKGSKSKSKFTNPPPNESAAKGTVQVSHSSRKTLKALKIKPAIEVLQSDVIATKVNHPRGPLKIRPLLTTLGVQGGGFGEEVPVNYQAVENGLKCIGVLIVLRDFGEFVEVDNVLWNKKMAPFVGEQYVQPCNQCHHKKTQCHKFLMNSVLCVHCHYTKLPCHVNKVPILNPLWHYCPQAYKTINAFESSMDTLSQHANALEEIVLNYMASLDAMAQLQGLCTQINHLCESLGTDTQVEEVIEEADDEGFDAGEVAEGEPGPSKKCKHSQK
ncbi:hypothetical protein IW261DRAFT_1558088 [Armillaria novae-zelandiae]|uniref:Uncharacterized protein n=1 Tax=Armillaria novae-zelandiae TaxID=153914 RepID=A0AA39PMN8_9AGAR|nr:hypothetical protein IW261DRAFT_1558088 [Armillaria novae-zelandiae]